MTHEHPNSHVHNECYNKDHEFRFESIFEHTHIRDPKGMFHEFYKHAQSNIEKYLDEILSHEKEELWQALTLESAEELIAGKEINGLTEDEVKALIIYSVITYAVNNLQEPEMMYMAQLCVAELNRAGYAQPVSSMFINSLFNFRNVYRPLYDLLDLTRNGRLSGDKVRSSEDYRLGVIDCILALRQYERASGFGFEDPNPRFNIVVKDQLDLFDEIPNER